MSIKLSAHIIGGSGDALRLTAQARSPLVKLVGDFGAAGEYAALPHHPLVIGRFVVADELRPDHLQELGRDPVASAAEYFDTHYRQRVLDHPAVAAWEGPNEIVTKTREAMAWYARFEVARVALLAALGRRAVVGNWSTGQPEPELWPDFAPALDALRAQGGYLGLHEYSEPSRNYDTWYMGRFERAPRDVPKLITESGTDSIPPVAGEPGQPPRHPAGQPWRQQFGDNVAAYAAFLTDYDVRLRDAPDVLGVAIFTFGSNWPDHNVEGSGLADRLIAYAQTAPAATNATPHPPLTPITAPAQWWERWPEGVLAPPHKLRATGRTITIVQSDGATVITQRKQSDEWDVSERRGALLRVFHPDTGPDWYVQASDVEPK